MLTQARLKELLHYDPATGLFTWRVARGHGLTGQVAGSFTSHGYVTIRVDGRRDYAHRFAVLYMTGHWPKDQVDHRDSDGCNNRWANLRQVTRSQNHRNARLRRDNTVGFKGVTRFGAGYMARIQVGGKSIYLGLFDRPEEAGAAYAVAACEHFGDYARVA